MEIKVWNLDYNVSGKQLWKTFEKFGKVSKSVVDGKGGAVVVMENEADACAACEALKGTYLKGREIKMRLAGGASFSPAPEATPSPSQTSTTPGPQFVNPYNFLRVHHKVAPSTVRPLLTEDSHWQHRFREGTHSGRVVCEITTETDLFIGAGKNDPEADKKAEKPAELLPFQLNGQRALPPSSLKGMLSGIMEAAANSALRVLEKADFPYSRRQEFKVNDMLNHIGLVKKRDDGQLCILPLKTGDPEKPPKNFDPSFPVYLDGYLNITKEDKSKEKILAALLKAKSDIKDFSVEQKFYFLNIKQLEPKNKGRFFLGYKFKLNSCLPFLSKQEKEHLKITNNYLENVKYKFDEIFILPDKYDKLSDQDKVNYKKGLFKILGVGPDRQGNIPDNRKHEFFLFVPDYTDKNLLPITSDALKDFHTLADDRARENEGPPSGAWLPYTPLGRQRDKEVRLRENDVVYYRANNAKEVTKISFSACWRDFCGNTREKNHAHGYFGGLDPLLLPPGLDNQNLKPGEEAELRLTPVCALLGFVEERKSEGAKAGLALAGRLFFSPGILSPEHPKPDEVEGEEKILPILANPKPPCPEFYFHRAACSETFITKSQLKPDGNFHPNGRKFYWHHPQPPAYVNKNNEKDKEYLKNFEQMSRLRPIEPQTKFLFAIDFFNLSDFELGLLLYALRPTDQFRHQLGMGKPLGMGCIRIDILNLLLVDRLKRYGEDDLFADGFFHYQTATQTEQLKNLREAFRAKNDHFNEKRFCTTDAETWNDTIDQLRQNFVKTMQDTYGDEDFLTPLENLGNPAAVQGLQVCYPPNPLEPTSRTESFKWFMRNAGKDKENINGRNVNIQGKKATLPQVPKASGKKAPTLPVDPRA